MQPWVEDEQMHKLYAVSLYVAIVSMFGGIGNIAPQNIYEYVSLTFILFTGCFFWAYVISSLCSMLATLSPHKTAFRNQMDELNHFMDENRFNSEHRIRIRRFFRAAQDFQRQSTYKHLLAKMSARLRGDTALLIGLTILRKVTAPAATPRGARITPRAHHSPHALSIPTRPDLVTQVWYFDLKRYTIEKDFLAHIALAMVRVTLPLCASPSLSFSFTSQFLPLAPPPLHSARTAAGARRAQHLPRPPNCPLPHAPLLAPTTTQPPSSTPSPSTHRSDVFTRPGSASPCSISPCLSLARHVSGCASSSKAT